MPPSDLSALVASVRNRVPYCRPVLTPEEATVLCDAIEELQRELVLARGAMQAQDNREKAAGEKCGVPYEQGGCDHPDVMADEILSLREENAELRELLSEAAPFLIYSILKAECGAPEHHRSDFIRYLQDDSFHNHEWRFGGTLGIGGKFYSDGRTWRVGCYREDDTPERLAVIDRTNGLLAELRKRLNQPTL